MEDLEMESLLEKWAEFEPDRCKRIRQGKYYLHPPASDGDGWHFTVNIIDGFSIEFSELAGVFKMVYDSCIKRGWLISVTCNGFALCIPTGTKAEKTNFKSECDTPEEAILKVYTDALGLVSVIEQSP